MVNVSRGVLAGGALGAATAGLAAGLALAPIAIGRVRLRPDPEALEPLGRLPGRGRTVLADDGVLLQVEEVGDPDASLTVIFAHGYTMEMACWHYQRRDLDDIARLVFYDQRGHGRSGRGAPETATIDQLGSDLGRVLSTVAPSGPVVLIGHSMGGMTVMALADQSPELFGPRVRGVALLGTSAGRLAELTFGLPAVMVHTLNRLAPRTVPLAQHRAGLVEYGRALGSEIAFVLTRRYTFASRGVSPRVVDFVERMIAKTPIDVIADFYETFLNHDKLGALPVLADLETLILCGAADVITPPEHSRAIAAQLPGAVFVELPAAGHMAMLEQHEAVTGHLRELLEQVLDNDDGRPDRDPDGRPVAR